MRMGGERREGRRQSGMEEERAPVNIEQQGSEQ